MGREISKFGNIEIDKNKFYRHKTSIFLRDVDIEKVLVSFRSIRFLLVKTTINTLLITCIMVTKLNY